MGDLAVVAFLFGPLFAGLIFHGLCIKFGWLRALATPIDRKALFRNRPLFGGNKTYRGILAVALGSAAGFTLQSLAPELQPPAFRALPLLALISLGFTLGAAAMLSELLNSSSSANSTSLPARREVAPDGSSSTSSTRSISCWGLGWLHGRGWLRRCLESSGQSSSSASLAPSSACAFRPDNTGPPDGLISVVRTHRASRPRSPRRRSHRPRLGW
jgi:hypothetical protein